MTHWSHKGEVKSTDRPKNSLLQSDYDFKQTAPLITNTDIEDELFKIAQHRIRAKNFDNYKITKNSIKEEEVPKYEDSDASEDIDDLTENEMQALFWQINKELDLICDEVDFVYGIEKMKGDVEKGTVKMKTRIERRDEKMKKKLAKNKNVTIL